MTTMQERRCRSLTRNIADRLRERGSVKQGVLEVKSVLKYGRVEVFHPESKTYVSIWVHWYNQAAGTMRVTFSRGQWQERGRKRWRQGSETFAEVSLLPDELVAATELLVMLLVNFHGGRAYEWTVKAAAAQEAYRRKQ